MATVGVTLAVGELSQVPPGAPEREINGIKYYLVPIAEDLEKKFP